MKNQVNADTISMEKIFDYCRGLSDHDNLRNLDFWIVEFDDKHPANNLCALKGQKMHMIIGQDGMFESGSSTRSRTGLWAQDTRHLSSILLSHDSTNLKANKYVRGLGFIYRQYGSIERIDYVLPKRALYTISLRSQSSEDIAVSFEILHEKSWPSGENALSYTSDVSPQSIRISSTLATTEIGCRSTGEATLEFNGNTVRIYLKNTQEATITISCDGSPPESSDFRDTVLFHESVKERTVLRTPSFELNKLFLWAKHDLLELFSEIGENSGFFAGMPVFSWFFGRDGEWMSMAATECGFHSLAAKHLDLLYRSSQKGRIPHEVPALISWKGLQPIDAIRSETGFMAIDSSPLWVMSRLQLATWTGDNRYLEGIDSVMNFILSCDRDSDYLIENVFSEKLIGWPESWAERRDGACVEINSWWIQALKMYSKTVGKWRVILEPVQERFERSFFSKENKPPLIYDSVDHSIRRDIRNAMLIVPAMYEGSDRMRDLLLDIGKSDMIADWGIRSISKDDPMYDGGYHTGMVWPLMTGWYTLALFKNGMKEKGMTMLKTFTNLAFSSIDPGRINEVYGAVNPEPVGQFFQGWSSSLFLQSVIEGLFGIPFAPEEFSTECVKPKIPDSWKKMSLEKVEFRGDFYDVLMDRSGVKIEKCH